MRFLISLKISPLHRFDKTFNLIQLSIANFLKRTISVAGISCRQSKNNSDCISVKNVVKQIIYIYGKGSIQKIKSEFSENSYLKLNSLKAEKELNWKPIYNVKKSIKKTIEWYNLVINKKKNPKIITNKQINEYMKACKWL